MNNKVFFILLLLVSACGKKSTYESVPKTCSVTETKIICPDGTSVLLPSDGKDGLPGLDGADGKDGTDGANGSDGQDGADGTQITLYDPCGDDPNKPDEVVMIFADGTILAWYLNLGFSVLQEGVTYQTTDSQKCKFKVVSGQVVEL